MATLNDFTNPDERLRFENELLKLKLEVEMGAQAMGSTDDLPPEVANAWLNSVYNFEKEFKNPENKKTVYEHLGKPIFRGLEELRPEEINRELDILMTKLNEHGFEINFICEYESALIYNFIVTELFPYEIFHKQSLGGMSVFTYEDFHPNYDYEIRRVTKEFLDAFFDEDEYHKFNMMYLDNRINTKNGRIISDDECVLIIREVQKVHFKKRLYTFEVLEATFDDKEGKSTSKITYTADGNSTQTVIVELNFTPNDYFYTINKINIPGILEI